MKLQMSSFLHSDYYTCKSRVTQNCCQNQLFLPGAKKSLLPEKRLHLQYGVKQTKHLNIDLASQHHVYIHTSKAHKREKQLSHMTLKAPTNTLGMFLWLCSIYLKFHYIKMILAKEKLKLCTRKKRPQENYLFEF